MAVHLIAQDKLSHMVALEGERIISVPIEEAVSRQKLVPLDSDLLLTAHGLDICLGNSREAIDAMRKPVEEDRTVEEEGC